jgi:hypothetical protein
MSLQRSVSRQNAETLAEIRRTAEDFATGTAVALWLHGVLQSHGLNAQEGILVRLNPLPEQGGTLYKGLWLSKGQEFWEFSVLVPTGSKRFAEVESFVNVTQAVAVSAHVPGTGKSFGYLAHEILREAHGG